MVSHVKAEMSGCKKKSFRNIELKLLSFMIIFKSFVKKLLQKNDNFLHINVRVTYNIFNFMMHITLLVSSLNVRMSAKQEISRK